MSEWAIPGYTELKELGSGGFGAVMLARHDATGTLVAIKYLRGDLAGGDPYFVEMFRAEAITLGSLDDPYVTRLYEYVESPSGAAIVMELIDGVTLRDILTRYGKTSPEAALVVLYGSLLGLAAAHARGVVHRDYKPANVMVNAYGASKLTDFGIAVLAGTDIPTGATAAYAPPEQWDAAPASPASDVYAATVTFYECLTGQRPFTGQSDETLAEQHRHGSVPMAPVPEALRPVVARGMAKDPQYRPANAAELAAELRVVAVGAYGEDWESHGRSQLGEAALLLAALWPSAGLPALQGTTVEQVQLHQNAQGSQGSQAGSSHAAAQGSQSHQVSRAELHREHLEHVRHEEHLSHLRYLKEHDPNRTSAAGRASRVGRVGRVARVARPASVVVTAAAVAVAAGTFAATAHAGGSSGGSASRPAAITAYQESVAPAASGPAGSFAYTTATAVVLRAVAAPRVVAKLPTSGGATFAWSADGRLVAWLINDHTLTVASITDGQGETWTCSCAGLAFQGDQIMTVSTSAAGGDFSTAVPELLAYNVGGAAPATEPITGITTLGSDSDFQLLTAAGNTLIVAYGNAGGSDEGGPQTLYRVNASGQATLLSGTKSGQIAGSLGDATTDQAGNEVGLVAEQRGGACGFVATAFVVNTVTGALTSPKLPSSGGGPGGFEPVGLWFDSAGAAHVAFVPNPSDCATTSAAPTFPTSSAVTDYQDENGSWVKTGQATIHSYYGPNGWLAKIMGAYNYTSAPSTLTITNGKTTTTIPGVTSFSWG